MKVIDSYFLKYNDVFIYFFFVNKDFGEIVNSEVFVNFGFGWDINFKGSNNYCFGKEIGDLY